ncbi:Bcr/CflA family efflux MFS transporter [Sporosarcina pasteurii]|uniref:Bcr/CflA family efflux transporter n=1 Tax=Sporosarcina pasteurii TaxID=1474 RepID=A0A380BCH2_SPOPA|nr:Bcr/CflA family efflux MFS transporter [Sporosarcina pasteurii]MDS9472881.1 Bcr/CflA family efflux MFS transporter [Sporosarcina pasteurii]QBQ06430.1 Bcr/CflA family efflux MFS transporter [Sporosarcina pasteurii]SUI98517.1 Sulfonamide resistance protein [Sporosarcina pasteurii]
MTTINGIKRLRFALLLGALAAMGPLTIDMYLPSFPTIVASFDTTASFVQVSLTACLLGIGIGQLILGPMSDVHGRKKPLLIALIVYFIASALCAFSPSIGFFIAARFMQGFAASAGIVISRAIVRDVYSGSALTKFFALLMLINNLAPILAPVLGGGILAFTDWTGVFAVLSAIGFLLFAIVLWRLEESLPEEMRVPSNLSDTIKNFVSLLKNREFMGYALAQGFIMAGIFAYVAGTPFVYQNIYGVSPQTFSLLFGMNGLGLIMGTQTVGRLTGVLSERRFLEIGLTMSISSGTLLLLAVLFNGPLITIVIPIFFFVASIGVIATSSFSLAMESQGHIAGSASALLGLLPFVLGAITAPLVGIAGEETAVPMGAIIFSSALIAVLSYIWLARDKKIAV